jgi:phosphoribosylformylglycinamidine synthase I
VERRGGRMSGRVAVIAFPGLNCESESARALERAGLAAEIVRWTQPASVLARFDAYVIPGGFSYQDRVRAGALAAHDPLVEGLASEGAAGKPVLGICNGAQVLVEAGLVPDDGRVRLALARNRMTGRSGYYASWVYVRVEPSPCVFTRGVPPGTLLPLPMAHGEGRFTSAEPELIEQLAGNGQVPLRYATADGEPADAFPANPNGAERAAAGVCNRNGNVLALMPHPERALDAGAIARSVAGPWAERRDAALATGAEADGPGMLFFTALRRHLEGA